MIGAVNRRLLSVSELYIAAQTFANSVGASPDPRLPGRPAVLFPNNLRWYQLADQALRHLRYGYSLAVPGYAVRAMTLNRLLRICKMGVWHSGLRWNHCANGTF